MVNLGEDYTKLIG